MKKIFLLSIVLFGFIFTTVLADDALIVAKKSPLEYVLNRLQELDKQPIKTNEFKFIEAVPTASPLIFTIVKGEDYEVVKERFKNFLAKNPSDAEKLNAYREIVRKGTYGDKGLNNMFKNFTDEFRIMPNSIWADDAILKLYYQNDSQLKGAARELLYAIKLDNSPQYKVLDMNYSITTESGKTDADILFEDRNTKEKIRMEVKDVKASSQNSDKARIMKQMDKMVEFRKREGVKQIFVSRNKIIPELKEYANKLGIPYLENMSVGKNTSINFVESVSASLKAGTTKVVYTTNHQSTAKEFSSTKPNSVKEAFQIKSRPRLSGFSLAGTSALPILGAVMSTMNLFKDINTKDLENRGLHITKDGVFLASNTAFLTALSSETKAGSQVLKQGIKQFSSVAKGTTVSNISKTLGRVGVAGLVVGSALEVGTIWNSDAPIEQKVERTSGATGGAVGAWGGFEAGATIGSFLGPIGTIVGGVLGAFIGGAAGDAVGSAVGREIMK